MNREIATDLLSEAYGLRPLLLRFRGKEAEQEFQKRSLVMGLPTIRAFLFVGTLLYALFGMLDVAVLGPDYEAVLLLRFGFILPVLLAVCGLSYLPAFIRFAQPVLTFAMFCAGLGIIAMTAVIEGPMRANYYAGLIMVLIYCAGLIRLHWTNAAVSTVILVLIYQPVALWLNPIPPDTLIANDFFLGMSASVGIFSSYVLELYIRLEYRNAEILKAEKERSIVLMEEAQAADHAKSEFLSIVSHELRTPLNAIIGFSELIRNQTFGPLGSQAYVEYIDDIYVSGTHLLRIISDVLDLSKAEVGKLTVHDEELNLTELLSRCCRMMRGNAAERGLRLSLNTAPSSPKVLGDSALLKQLFLNLLSNAIKFTPSGGSVTVAFSLKDSGALTVTVADTGVGIAEKDLEKVLLPFSQVESAYNRQHSGAGLGLALAKRIIELHGGTLKLESKLGAGTRVHTTIPAERIQGAPPAASNVVA